MRLDYPFNKGKSDLFPDLSFDNFCNAVRVCRFASKYPARASTIIHSCLVRYDSQYHYVLHNHTAMLSLTVDQPRYRQARPKKDRPLGDLSQPLPVNDRPRRRQRIC